MTTFVYKGMTRNPEIGGGKITDTHTHSHTYSTRLGLMRILKNWSNERQSIIGSEKIVSPRFHAVSFVRKQLLK